VNGFNRGVEIVFRWGQGLHDMPTLTDPLKHVTCLRAANECGVDTSLSQGIGQRQATHDMACANL
jgi:hypothetical protein